MELLAPLQKRHKELVADPAYVEEVLRRGAERAREMAKPTVDAAYRAIGLLPLPERPYTSVPIGGMFLDGRS